MATRNDGVHNNDTPAIAAGSAFIGLMNARSTEARLRWNGAQIVVLLNIPSLFWMGYILTTRIHAPGTYLVFAVGCALAAILNWQWYAILRRDGKFFEFWNASIQALERANTIEGDVHIYTSFEYDALAKSRHSIQRTLERFAAVVIFVWAGAAIALASWSLAKMGV